MSREIKFKAWNKELKSMSKPFTFGQVLNFNDKNIKSLTNEIILQFTGLKDKNGIDIYDGDIVKRIANMRDYSDADGTEEELLEVFYLGIELLPFSETGVSMEEYEVIGNIHENKNLL